MRIVVWNCQMAFRRKFPAIEALGADIVVVPESESPEFLSQKGAKLPWENHVWVGENSAKGLSVFSGRHLPIEISPHHDPAFRYIAPVRVSAAFGAFDLFAVWTQAEKPLSKSYVTHALNAVEHYRDMLLPGALLAGDFNSSPVFKTNGKKHLELVEILKTLGFSSVYHTETGQDHGGEDTPTFYLHRNRLKPYHLDYAFCHDSQKPLSRSFSIGRYDDWIGDSDHMPLILDI